MKISGKLFMYLVTMFEMLDFFKQFFFHMFTGYFGHFLGHFLSLSYFFPVLKNIIQTQTAKKPSLKLFDFGKLTITRLIIMEYKCWYSANYQLYLMKTTQKQIIPNPPTHNVICLTYLEPYSRRNKKTIKKNNNNNPPEYHLLPQHAKVNLICMKMRQSRTTAATMSWSHIFNIKHFLIPSSLSIPSNLAAGRLFHPTMTTVLSCQMWSLGARQSTFRKKKWQNIEQKTTHTYTHTRIASTRQPIHD